MNWKYLLVLLLAALVLGACASTPTGPSVRVLPGPGKTFEAFQTDDMVCRQWAQQQIGASPGRTADKTTAGGAALGTGIGAALGAGIGAATGSAATGAAIGGATGLVGGTAMGSNRARASEMSLQNQYDNAYQQCMYSKGNQVPGYSSAAQPYTEPSSPSSSGKVR
ncbi:MAG: hypothetical protein A4E57_01730 [Syntrophorhabdaceae bacterium PtaU1.Bin034]|jgi:uncharacterized protein YcfJ|nr:MAG: hypothetical protein A4E57_01730 [Syntrophorhabdaceae bacterium PtaU1.Bin034]